MLQECPQVTLIGEAATQEEAYQLIQTLSPSLVFMDIQMKEGTSFDLLEKLHNEGGVHFEIIFVTAYGKYEYATKAIEYSALDFITKPIEPDKLKTAVEKAEKVLDKNQYAAQIALLLENLARPNTKSKRIAFHLAKGIVEFVEVENIIYLEADTQVTYIFLKNGEKLTAMRNLGHYSKLLLTDYDFFPISNKHLVHLAYVTRYNHSELTVRLTNGEHLFASRRGGKDFRQYLNNNKQDYPDLQNGGLGGFLKRLLGG